MPTISQPQDILGSTLSDNGSVVCQLGDSVTQAVSSDNAEYWGCMGVACRPSKPTPGQGACQAIAVEGGDRDTVIAIRDTRSAEIAGNLGEGETCVFAAGPEGLGQACVVLKGDGSITLSTKDDNTASGQGVYLKIGPQALEFHSPWGYIVFSKEAGFNVFDQSGATMAIGGVANPLQPNRIRLSACAIRVDAPQVFLGPSTSNGGKGVFMAPALAPLPSIESGVPTIIGVGFGVTLGPTSTSVFMGI